MKGAAFSLAFISLYFKNVTMYKVSPISKTIKYDRWLQSYRTIITIRKMYGSGGI